MKLTKAEWQDSQRGELGFWNSQHGAGNLEQEQRADWYKYVCFPQWFATADLRGKVLIDLGSGPQGIMHHIDGAAVKYAVDPLMAEFERKGYKTGANGVTPINADGEDFGLEQTADVVFCLNCLDHVRDPRAVIRAAWGALKDGGELVLCVDLRPADLIDRMHKLRMTREWLNRELAAAGFGYTVQIIPHQAGNPAVQYCAVCRKGQRRASVIVAVGHELPQNVVKTCAAINATKDKTDELILVYDGSPVVPDAKCDRGIVVEKRDDTGGVGYCRNVGAMAATGDVLIFVDAHMAFPAGWINSITEHLKGNPKDLTSAMMVSMDREWNPHKEDSAVYQGAHMVEMQTWGAGEHMPFSARWNREELRNGGEIGCVMGACYGIRRNRYFDIGQPLGALRSWGGDEEILSVANWLCGGRAYLLPIVARHMFGAPKTSGGLTHVDCLNVWANRYLIASVMPMPEDKRQAYIDWMGAAGFAKEHLSDVRAVAEARPEYKPLRDLLHKRKRDWAGYCAKWMDYNPPDNSARRAVIAKADAERVLPKPVTVISRRPFTARIVVEEGRQYVCKWCNERRSKIRVVHDNGFALMHCDACERNWSGKVEDMP